MHIVLILVFLIGVAGFIVASTGEMTDRKRRFRSVFGWILLVPLVTFIALILTKER